MPTFRADLDRIAPYVPGRGEQEILREYGLDHVIKLASNESPLPPFPEVVEAIAQAAAGINRYPDTTFHELRTAISEHLGIAGESILLGGGGTGLLLATALAVGGPDTSAVYAAPSFVMYRIGTAISGSRAIEVPVDGGHRHDLDAMAAAVEADTSLVYICNPNNPTGTHVSSEAIRSFVDGLPESVLVMVDEAYCEFADASDYESLVTEAATSPNLVVLRTFSKVFGLAGLRIGFLVGHPELLSSLRRTQLPFTVTDMAQVAALEALRQPQRVADRVVENARGRKQLMAGLASMGLAIADSQTNFVFVVPGVDPGALTEGMVRRGVIIRPTGTPWVRITVGTEAENEACLTALDATRAALR